MWRKLKNWFYSLTTYADLSPDMKLRQRINHALRDRPALSVEQWYDTCWQSPTVSREVVTFVYTHLERYSGLGMARIRPSDRLEEDLCFSQVCWFDWQLTLCQDFYQRFTVDISDRLDIDTLLSIEDLVVFLDCQCKLPQH